MGCVLDSPYLLYRRRNKAQAAVELCGTIVDGSAAPCEWEYGKSTNSIRPELAPWRAAAQRWLSSPLGSGRECFGRRGVSGGRTEALDARGLRRLSGAVACGSGARRGGRCRACVPPWGHFVPPARLAAG